MIKGKGVDCVHFVAAVFAEAGIVEPFERLPSYPTTWGLVSPENVLGVGLQKILECDRLPWDRVKVLEFGDVVIFKAGRQSNHAGLFLDGRIWHVMTGGVVHPALPIRFAKGIQEVVRLKKKGWKTEPNSVNVHRLLKS
jgi:cell wall-associated NlpC family hydrolase